MGDVTRLVFALLLLAGCPSGDADGDGWDAPEDCDDADASVHPEATEVCGNGVDEDCDGGGLACRATGDVTPEGGWGGWSASNFGAALAAPGDVDGDGFADVLVGAPGDATNGAGAGAAVLLFGSPSGFDPERSITWRGAFGGDRLGSALAGADLDGDGAVDLVFGAPGNGVRDASVLDQGTGLAQGAAYLALGPITAAGHEERAVDGLAAVRGPENACLGSALAATDGALLVGAPCLGSEFIIHPHGNLPMVEDGPGAAALFLAPDGERTLADADLRVDGDLDWDRLGAAVAFGGDGRIGIGAPDYHGADWINLEATGRVLVYGADARGVLTPADAALRAVGACCGDAFHEALGATLAESWEGLVAGAPRLASDDAGGGAVRIDAPDGGVDGSNAGDWLAAPEGRGGAAVAAGFDLDCDGVEDVALGAPDDATVGLRGGRVWVRYGGLTGYERLGSRPDETLSVLPTNDNQQLGAALAVADIDGDGCEELLVGAPEARDAGPGAGAVRVVFSTGY